MLRMGRRTGDGKNRRWIRSPIRAKSDYPT